MVSRIPWEINRRLGKEFSPDFIQNLRNIVNVRPTLITPLWVNGLLKQNNVPQIEQDKFKQIWNELVNEFLDLEFVHSLDRHFEFDAVDALNLILRFSSKVSIRTINDIVKWIRERFISGQPTFSHNALKESAFLNRTAQFIVYGHTHHPEVVPLDSNPISKQKPFNQMCLNTGTWHTYYDLAVHNPGEEKFIPYQVLSYLSFYKDDQRGGRRFEAWSGSLSE
jgi:hypothetical protein